MSAPVKHTCPDIDDAIKHIRRAIKMTSSGMKEFEKDSDAYCYLYDIEAEIEGLEDVLEDLRDSNDALRKWGHELEEQLNNIES